MATKTISFNETEKAIMQALGESETPLTLAEISQKIGKELKSGNINALCNSKGKVETVGDRVITCECCGHKRKVKEYQLVSTD